MFDELEYLSHMKSSKSRGAAAWAAASAEEEEDEEETEPLLLEPLLSLTEMLVVALVLVVVVQVQRPEQRRSPPFNRRSRSSCIRFGFGCRCQRFFNAAAATPAAAVAARGFSSANYEQNVWDVALDGVSAHRPGGYRQVLP